MTISLSSRKIHKNNTSGVTGITERANGQWLVRIKADEYVGIYWDLDEAIAARKAAEKKHGY